MRDGGDDAELRRILSQADARKLVRAFSAYFSLINTAERVHRVRRAVAYRRGDAPQPESLASAVREAGDLLTHANNCAVIPDGGGLRY